jgi:hypothetical protein
VTLLQRVLLRWKSGAWWKSGALAPREAGEIVEGFSPGEVLKGRGFKPRRKRTTNLDGFSR